MKINKPNAKTIVSEYENMNLKDAMSVIMDTPLTELLGLTKSDKDIVFSELEFNYALLRDKFTFRDFIKLYPGFLKDSGMNMNGEIRDTADKYIELADTIEYICNIADQAEHISEVRLIMNGTEPFPEDIKGFIDKAKVICALNVFCSMKLKDYFARLDELYDIRPDVYPYCNNIMNSSVPTVGDMLITIRNTLHSNSAYKLFEEIVLEPFSIKFVHENIIKK